MPGRKKPPAKKRAGLAKRGEPSASKARQKKKTPQKNLRTRAWTIFVTYPADQNSKLNLDPNDLKVGKEETVIYWMKAAGSSAITFILDASTDRCPFGKLTLDRTATKVTLHYHGDGDGDKDWKYQAQLTNTTGEVKISGGGPLLGGSTIKNH
jgi:hypothetical protein